MTDTNGFPRQDRPEADPALLEALRRLPQAEPPAGFADAVMARLRPKRLPWWRRAWLWAVTPRPLTVTPLRLAGAALAAGLLLTLALPLARHGGQPAQIAVVPADGLRPVTFVLPDPHHAASQVAVIGSFNNWTPKGFEMRYADGAWVLHAELPQGTHEYVFLLDGRVTRTDPEASLSKDDGFGNRNSVLLLGGGHGQAL